MKSSEPIKHKYDCEHTHMFGECFILTPEESHKILFGDDNHGPCEICDKCNCCGKIH